MNIASPIPHKKARIEIIPLIDVMFFLLACMMMVSLSMIKMRGLKVDLPTAVTATAENKSDFLAITIGVDGAVHLDAQEIERTQLVDALKDRLKEHPDLRVYIQADMEARHGDVMQTLDKVRSAGIQKIGFQVKGEEPAAPAATARVSSAPSGGAAVARADNEAIRKRWSRVRSEHADA